MQGLKGGLKVRLTKDDFDFCKNCNRTGFEGGILICITFKHIEGKIQQIKNDCIEKQMYDKLRMYEQKYE